MHEEEEWKPIEDFPSYLISSYGRVGRVNDANELIIRTIQSNDRGFPVILLSDPVTHIRYMRQINTLVAKAFLPPPAYDDETAVWHKDGDLMNCHVANLKWERRDRVLEWNDMQRRGEPKYRTPMVKNNRTGVVYRNAYECAMEEGKLESSILWLIETSPGGVFEGGSMYSYVSDIDLKRDLL